MIVLMASTCLQNDCQAQPHVRICWVWSQASSVSHEITVGKRWKWSIVSMPTGCVCMCVCLFDFLHCSSWHASALNATATHLSLSYASSCCCSTSCHLLPASVSILCVRKSHGMTESHSVMRPQHLIHCPKKGKLKSHSIAQNTHLDMRASAGGRVLFFN